MALLRNLILTSLLAPLAWSQSSPWLGPQVWRYDTEAPVVSLGQPGAFDDTHIFAPWVSYEDGNYTLWYCGSRGDVADRVFRMGRAVSANGVDFTKHPEPVLAFEDGVRSVLTPSLLRTDDGATLREDGKLQLFFSGADLTTPDAPHALHRSSSEEGAHWSPPSEALLENVYAPTVIRDGDRYRLWYTDVSAEPWIIRHAESIDGNTWAVTETPSIVIDQDWERDRLFYSTVVKSNGAYLMWYGAYWTARDNATAIGFAVSDDGIHWTKHPMNPVVRPNPARPWESHYTTSQSLLRMPDGRWRIWYGTRKEPPFVNKYFAIGTAFWNGPQHPTLRGATWFERVEGYRHAMAEILTLPEACIEVDGKSHRTREGDGYTVESVTYASGTGSRVTALLWLPRPLPWPVPAVVLACGHGGSKSALYAQYAGQLYAKMGFACLVPDTIGEEERNAEGKMGSRAHDLYRFNQDERIDFVQNKLKRSILGKIAWDLTRGIDYLQTRPEIDAARIGIMGYSLGGASAGAATVIDTRINAAMICGWGFSPLLVHRGKECTRLPYEAFSDLLRFDEMTALLAPHAATLFYSGDSDAIIDAQENGAALARDVKEAVMGARAILDEHDIPHTIEWRFQEGADHRPLFLTREAVAWMQDHLQTPDERHPIPEATIRFGDWAESHGAQIEKLYNTEAREAGLPAVDISATLYTPNDLACFPEQPSAGAEYTFEWWVDRVLETRR